MPVWRCPHCATPQTEASRCWVCRRSTTSCVTCRHYQRGISGGLGLCGLDPKHNPAAATDVRACWVDAARVTDDLPAADAPAPDRPAAARGAAASVGRAPRTFVPIESLATRRDGGAVAVLDAPADIAGVETLERRDAADAVDPLGAARPAAVTDPGLVPSPTAVKTPATSPARPIPGRWWLWGDPDPWPERLGERWA